MNAQQFYNSIHCISLEATCVGIELDKWKELMEGAVRACKKTVNKLLIEAEYLTSFEANLYNPYDYYRTDTHIIYVHSGIEHFYKIN